MPLGGTTVGRGVGGPPLAWATCSSTDRRQTSKPWILLASHSGWLACGIASHSAEAALIPQLERWEEGAMNLFGNHMMTAALAEALVSIILLALGFVVGKHRERRRLRGRDLTEYDFYPYQTTADNFAEFSLRDFRLGMHYLLRNRDSRAARQLISMGEQNNVRDLLDDRDKRSF